MGNYDGVEEVQESASGAKLLIVIEMQSKDQMKILKDKLRTSEFNLGQYGAKMY